MQLVLGNFPCGTWVHGKLDSQKSDRCSLCRKALRAEKGVNFCELEVPRETVGHISSAGCKGQKEVVTLAHNNVFRDLLVGCWVEIDSWARQSRDTDSVLAENGNCGGRVTLDLLCGAVAGDMHLDP